MSTQAWRITWWSLLVIWTACAILDMAHIRAGILTSHGADLTLPAWLYITVRSLDDPRRNTWMTRRLGYSPALVAAVMFVGSAATEASQFFWPHGVFRGVFDVYDILAYGIGIAICYFLDSRSTTTRGTDVSGATP